MASFTSPTSLPRWSSHPGTSPRSGFNASRPQRALLLVLLAAALLALGPLVPVAHAQCTGTTWTGSGAALYDCSSTLVSYAASSVTSPATAQNTASGGLLGSPYDAWTPGTTACLTSQPDATNPAAQNTTWYTTSNGVVECNITIAFSTPR
ncbi:hypothetical protein HYH03_015570, partial [Edaphochlamys debaryana]